ncbi:MAG: hypothetical protein NC343_04925 [Muribaculum sp.]|nr:hypothetical protein [Muribaculaceae bacterium]MCM1081075.1 hypothetical protein [Muribaculum sp.]
MKKEFLSIILVLTFINTCFANVDGFTARFNITGFQDSTAMVARIHDGNYYSDWRFDTIYIVNGTAKLHDVSKVKEPARMYVFTDSGTITTYVQNGHNELIFSWISPNVIAVHAYLRPKRFIRSKKNIKGKLFS